jgi:hypothetical protein
MGWDATFYFPDKTKRSDAEHFLGLIGYKRVPSDSISRQMKATSFYYPSHNDPARLSGVTAKIYFNEDGSLVATSRANIWCTRRDTELQNLMLRELKRYFGGYFVSDFGRNRPFVNDRPNRKGVEAACFIASSNFLNSVKRLSASTYSFSTENAQKPQRKSDYSWAVNQANPGVISANLGTVYLVALLEEFFKFIFVEAVRSARANLKFSRFKPPSGYFLERAFQGEIALEEAVAEGLSFQNAESIRQNFSGLPRVAYVSKYLGKPISAKSKTLRAKSLQDLFDRRHRIVHQAELDFDYLPEHFSKHIKACERLVEGLYRALTLENNWPYERPW